MTDKTTLQKSLKMIQKLKKRLEEQPDFSEPVAIIGMGCRLPHAENVQEFWQLLCDGKNVITPLSEERWELLKETTEPELRNSSRTYPGGYLKNIADFDAYFFGISPREAMRMDPQQRLLLEVSYQAFEDAGLTVEQLAGSHTGVFASLYASQFGHLQTLESEMDALFLPTGSAVSIAANRLSYLFDLRGPSMVLDTACSSSLIAIQLACLNLQAKVCEQALVSAVNINFLPSIHEVLAQAKMLSPTGQCHTFDAIADGYVPGEGACALLLKPLSKALRDGDKLYALIAASAVNQDGKTNGLTAPNGLQQEKLLQEAYLAANLSPLEVAYIECHGTGTLLGDPIEVEALGKVVGKHRDPQKPCWIGSVKTNLGHLEPAAGLVSLIKSALILHHKTIPVHLNYTTPNPLIPFEQLNVQVAQVSQSLPRYGESCIVGVSAFGFGGANAHIVLKEVPLSLQKGLPDEEGGFELFTLSAKDKSALYELIRLWEQYLKKTPSLTLGEICYNVHIRRSHYAHRLAIVTDSLGGLIAHMEHLVADFTGTHEQIFLSSEAKKQHTASKVRANSLALKAVAEAYVQQARIDWDTFEESRFYPHMKMPFYPWQHKTYWPSFSHHGKYGSHNRYPLRGRLLASPLPMSQFAFTFDAHQLPEVQDTFHVAHAGFYLDMLVYADKRLHPHDENSPCSIEALSFSSPLVIPTEKLVEVQLLMSAEKEEGCDFTFYSYDGRTAWTEHAKGRLIRHKAVEVNIPPHEKIKQNSIAKGDKESFYKKILSMGMPAGDTIRWVSQYWVGDQEVWSTMRGAKASERGETFALERHPGIIDACIQTIFFLQEFKKPYVASHMGRVVLHYQSAGEPAYIHTKLKKIDSEGATIIADWYLWDKDYKLLIQCQDVCMTQLNDTMNINAITSTRSLLKCELSESVEESKVRILDCLSEQFARVFSMPKEDVKPLQPLRTFGMDSLLALAILRIIEASFQTTYSLPQLMSEATMNDIAEHILAQKFIGYSSAVKKDETGMNTLWIANRKVQPKAKARLFCFPYGGGGASIFREWSQELPSSIEVCPVQLPGRENRLDEEPIASMDILIPLLAKHLHPLFDTPFAFFGHSFGSLIEFELTRYLRQHQLPEPQHLFVSAYPDPSTPSKSLNQLLKTLKEQGIHLFDLKTNEIAKLSTEQLTLLSTIFRENGIVDYSDERMNQSIIQVLLPIFIGDMNLVKNYTYRPQTPLSTPITVFVGEQDTWVTPADHEGWRNQTLASCDVQRLDSGHLFIREKKFKTIVLQTIAATLEQSSVLEMAE